jgi:hypothetical protein
VQARVDVARPLAQTGVPWLDLGDLDRARQVLEESLDLFARTSGPHEPGRSTALNILAAVEGRAGNLARDLDLLDEAPRVIRVKTGPDSREGPIIRANMAIGTPSGVCPRGGSPRRQPSARSGQLQDAHWEVANALADRCPWRH